tara:strand:- start:118 stop:423 length:306 start_codon:yes stop_codon:yes gene_type:complete
MKDVSYFEFEKCYLSNDLWPKFINIIGFNKAKLAVSQALDLQRMQGTNYTLPILIIETCGTALISSNVIKTHIGLSCVEKGMILIYSNKLKAIQLLRENID